MSKDTGGPAFPGLHPSAECHYQDEGMTLRDYFAAQAVQSLLQTGNTNDATLYAADAYRIADAMIAERAK